jgi:acyl-CoA synthetase (NDP forming)
MSSTRPVDVRPLLEPRSIALLGASDRPSARSRAIHSTLAILGYTGDIYPINPRYETVGGLRCHPSLADLPQEPDVVAFCIGQADVLQHLEQAAVRGARAAVVYEGGFAERGEAGRALQSRIVGLCREASIALCGPNCMGVLNPVHRSSVYKQAVRDPQRLAGNVGLVSQSGSVCIGLLTDVRRFGFSHVVSSGNEAVVTTVDYLEALIDDPHTRVIALFMESVQQPERFVAALDRAAACGKPVVVLKVGRNARTAQAIQSHTGGLAGSSRVFSEVLRAHRAIEVFDLDEFAEVIAACQAIRWPAGRRLAVVTASGGQAELALDVASAFGCDLAPIDEALRARLEALIGPVPGDGNPLDAWGSGDFQATFPQAMRVLDESGRFDAIVMCMDGADGQPIGNPARVLDFAQVLVEAARDSRTPCYGLNLRPGIVSTAQAALLAGAGLALLGGSRQGLGALDRLARWMAPAGNPKIPVPGLADGLFAELERVPGRPTINEFDAKRVLAAADLPVARERRVATLDEAEAAARDIGYPVVLKVVSDAIAHKTELGLVQVDLRDAPGLRAAWERLLRRVPPVGPGVPEHAFLVQEMVRGGLEVFVGIHRDPNFGLVIAFGLGGILVEVLDDTALRPLPLRDGEAAALVRQIRGAALLDGVRGGAPLDVPALIDCIEVLADLAVDAGEALSAIDLNPIIVLPAGQGCRIVDALIVPSLTKGPDV